MRIHTSILRTDSFRDEPLWPDETIIEPEHRHYGQISPCGEWVLTSCISHNNAKDIIWQTEMRNVP